MSSQLDDLEVEVEGLGEVEGLALLPELGRLESLLEEVSRNRCCSPSSSSVVKMEGS